jgi:hypothetical protein
VISISRKPVPIHRRAFAALISKSATAIRALGPEYGGSGMVPALLSTCAEGWDIEAQPAMPKANITEQMRADIFFILCSPMINPRKLPFRL